MSWRKAGGLEKIVARMKDGTLPFQIGKTSCIHLIVEAYWVMEKNTIKGKNLDLTQLSISGERSAQGLEIMVCSFVGGHPLIIYCDDVVFAGVIRSINGQILEAPEAHDHGLHRGVVDYDFRVVNKRAN